MKGLPGRLTKRHIELAKERGDNFIFYKGVNYPLTKLKEMAGIKDGTGISRTKPKSKTRQDIHSNRIDNSDGESPESSGDSFKE